LEDDDDDDDDDAADDVEADDDSPSIELLSSGASLFPPLPGRALLSMVEADEVTPACSSTPPVAGGGDVC
jgi:hypothetical protein